jgi:hypothetical protein
VARGQKLTVALRETCSNHHDIYPLWNNKNLSGEGRLVYTVRRHAVSYLAYGLFLVYLMTLFNYIRYLASDGKMDEGYE